MTKIVLVGQPNCGKSTLFNTAAGYKAVVSNYPGTTIEFVTSPVSLEGQTFELVDLPAIYSLSPTEPDELATRDYLFSLQAHLVVNIIDASILSRSLELTLELLELKIPLVVCLNMMDEAERKGIQIDVQHLEADLGVPVVPTVAIKGQGVQSLFQTGIKAVKAGSSGKSLPLSLDIESSVSELIGLLGEGTSAGIGVPPRLLALKLLEEDRELEARLRGEKSRIIPRVRELRRDISRSHGRPADVVLASERHSLAMNLFEHVAQVRPAQKELLRNKVDRYLMHPLWGYVFLALVLFALFNLIFNFGSLLEAPLLAWFDKLSGFLGSHLDRTSFFFTVFHGMIQGFSGGVGIVLPYLIPFLFGLALLEDIGYIPRVAFLMDSIMHRIGLHGKAVIPFVLGYGCSVPAVMGIRMMSSKRDRFITGVLLNFIPCAARTTIIFAMVAYYVGASRALFLYVLNIVVIALAGNLLSRLQPELSPGMILEIPSYKFPSLKSIVKKIWFRLREFIFIAFPMLIVGSVVLSLIEYFEYADTLNRIFAPFTSGLLGLPKEVSITLIFGILRKELSVIMLVQALGTSDFGAVMSHGQMMVFTVFSIFYIPCLATLTMLRSVLGTKGMLFTLFFTTAVATLMAVIFRVGYGIIS